MTTTRRTFWTDFKTFFLRGLGILLPSVLTLWLLFQAGVFLLETVAEPINRGVRSVVVWGVPQVYGENDVPDWFRVTEDDIVAFQSSDAMVALTERLGDRPNESEVRDAVRRQRVLAFWNRHQVFGFRLFDAGGLFIAIVLLYLAGALLGGFIGRRIYERVESLLARIPVFKQIYPHIKQLVDLIIGERKMAFRRSVLVEYPGKGSWTIGLVTGPSMAPVCEHLGGEAVAVFVPTSPTPMTGFTINVREDAVIDLDLSVDEALRYVISAGVLVPERHARDGAAVDALPRAKVASEGDQAGSAA